MGWDDKQCTGSEQKGCCNKPNLPWFHQEIESTQADTELRNKQVVRKADNELLIVNECMELNIG